MHMLKTKRPPEAPADPDPVSRLERVLDRERFRTVQEAGSWSGLGERVWARQEQVLFAPGETVVILIEQPVLDEKILSQATGAIMELFRASGRARQALSVFQTTTVYVCFVTSEGTPPRGLLGAFIRTAGGAVIIPVILIPDHNSVVYPDVSWERGISPIRRRVEYLQFLLGEKAEPVEIHRQTVQTFWLSVAIAGLLVIVTIAAAMM